MIKISTAVVAVLIFLGLFANLQEKGLTCTLL